MRNHLKDVSGVLKLALVASLTAVMITAPSAAFANTSPNAYTSVGQSWIDVPQGSKVYLENFGAPYADNALRDDAAIYYIGTGITCTYNNVVATGPFLTAQDLNASHCLNSQSNSVDPIDSSTRAGAIPFGFTVNFFGQNANSAWPNTNGGIFFGAPDNQYDFSMPRLAAQARSSAMFALGADLYYVPSASNFWTAQTTIDGHDAVVFTWENFEACCDRPVAEDLSFQIALIDFGGGDFNAYYNYDSFNFALKGYASPSLFVDLETDVTPNTNIVTTQDASFVSSSCTRGRVGQGSAFGTASDSPFVTAMTGSPFYFKLQDASLKTISLWSDSSCSVPITSNQVQNVANDGYSYIEFQPYSSTYKSISVGWATYDLQNSKIQWTELLRNVSWNDLLNSAANPLTSRTLNTTVPGRFVIGQRNGQTVTSAAAVNAVPGSPSAGSGNNVAGSGSSPAPALAATGSSSGQDFMIASVLGLLGAGLISVSVVLRRRRDGSTKN